MNTTDSASPPYLNIAESYYAAMLAKDFEKMGRYLHENIHFKGPLAEMHGKEPVVQAAQNFGSILQDIHIRQRFEAGPQIMLAYDMTLPAPIGRFPAAVLMTFTGQLISTIELFYDASPFEERKNEIFERT